MTQPAEKSSDGLLPSHFNSLREPAAAAATNIAKRAKLHHITAQKPIQKPTSITQRLRKFWKSLNLPSRHQTTVPIPIIRTMRIEHSTSCNTLVDVNENDCKINENNINLLSYGNQTSLNLEIPEPSFQPTELLLPTIKDIKSPQSTSSSTNLTLPTESSPLTVDECLFYNETIRQSAQQAIDNGINCLSPSNTSDPVLYIHQREVGHVSESQYKESNGVLLTSDSATTCHVLALFSSSQGGGGGGTKGTNKTMSSLTHLDSPDYDTCLREMMDMHYFHHEGNHNVHMNVHVVGGYKDCKGTSRETTSHLIHFLAEMAEEFKSLMDISLDTCVLTRLNDSREMKYDTNDNDSNSDGTPIYRGLTLHSQTGEVRLVKAVDPSLHGPEETLRRVRLWSPPSQCQNLLVVHDPYHERLRIEPFTFEPFPDMELFLTLPDKVLLEYTSTSPECEGEDFCDLLRANICFLRDVTPLEIFGKGKRRKSLVCPHQNGKWQK